MARSKSKKNATLPRGVAQITGRGDYRTSLNDLKQRVDRVMRLAPKGSFGRAGSAAGMAFGGPVGAAVGGALGKGLSAITGYGDYQVKSNSLSTISTSVDTVPQFVRNDHAVRVIHREFVKDITVPSTPGAFVNDTFVINPSNQELFPWLSSLSKQYQQYNIRGMIVEFKSMSSDYAAAGPLGTVAIATNYNVNDTPFPNKIALENSEFAVSCKPSMSLMHAIECDPEFSGRTYYYVRDPATEGTAVSDARLYDVGLLQVATAGLPGSAGSTLGEMWVSYDIEFTKPVLPGALAPSGGTAPTLVDGFALTSQRDGSSSKSGGAIPRIVYTQTSQPSLTANAVTTPFSGTSANIAITLDDGLDGEVTTVSSSGSIGFKKDGLYTVKYSAHADTTSSEAFYSAFATLPTGSTFTNIGTGLATLVDSATVAQHGYGATGSGVEMFVHTISFVVSGCGADGSTSNSVALVSPSFTAAPGNLCTPTSSVISITWVQESPAYIVE